MSRFHDPRARSCSCFSCNEARYREAAIAAQLEAERAAHKPSTEARLARCQIPLPMPGVAYLAHHRTHLLRSIARDQVPA